jgi:D-glycero-D-manno-heptose 1,7-bisphosphate phosphatase
MSGIRPGLILDRDGVINHDPGYLYRIEDCRFIDGIFPLVRAFRQRGFAVVIATNQAGIGRGLYTEADFLTLMDFMKGEFHRHSADIDAVYHCPYHPQAGVGPYRREHPWRKPGAGMILQAASDLGLDLAASWMIGDKASDMEAGRTAGVGTLVFLATGNRFVHEGSSCRVVSSLSEVQTLLVDDHPAVATRD